MFNAKFVKILRTLTKTEQENFEKYLYSAYRNEKATLVIYDYIKKFGPDFTDAKRLDIEYAYPKIFQEDTTMNRKKAFNGLFKLTSWLKDFLLLDKIRSGTFEGHIFLATILKEKELESEFVRVATELQSLKAAIQKPVTTDYVNGMIANHLLYHQTNLPDSPSHNDALTICNRDADIAYALYKTKLACETARLKSREETLIELNSFLPALELAQQYAPEIPLLQLYLSQFYLATEKTNDRYAKAEALLQEHAPHIHKQEAHQLFSYMRSYNAQQILDGDDSAWIRGHNLNKIGVDSGQYDKDMLDSNQFTNIISYACGAGDLDWARQFLERLQHDTLPLLNMKEVPPLSEALIFSAENKLREALFKIKDINFRDENLRIKAKALLLRLYYELDNDEYVISFYCAAFMAYLKRNMAKDMAGMTAMVNFIKIIKFMTDPDLTQAEIETYMEEHKPTYFKSWIVKMAKMRS